MIPTASLVNNPRIDAAAIIANTQTEFSRIVCDFNLDPETAGMTKGINERLTSDRKTFLENDRVQDTNAAFDDRLERRIATLGSLLRHLLEGRLQVSQ
jgi:hypothetical protein